MAGESLRTVSELLALFPDNTSGLITALASREQTVSMAPAIGVLESDPVQTPFAIPLVAGVPVAVPAQLVLPLFRGNYWQLDGNNAMEPSYAAEGITVPPGHLRFVDGLITMQAAKATGGTEVYSFAGTQGIATGDEFQVTLTGDPSSFTMQGGRVYDVSLGEPVSFTVESAGGADLILYSLRFSLESMIL